MDKYIIIASFSSFYPWAPRVKVLDVTLSRSSECGSSGRLNQRMSLFTAEDSFPIKLAASAVSDGAEPFNLEPLHHDYVSVRH